MSFYGAASSQLADHTFGLTRPLSSHLLLLSGGELGSSDSMLRGSVPNMVEAQSNV